MPMIGAEHRHDDGEPDGVPEQRPRVRAPDEMPDVRRPRVGRFENEKRERQRERDDDDRTERRSALLGGGRLRDFSIAARRRVSVLRRAPIVTGAAPHARARWPPTPVPSRAMLIG